MSVKDKDQRLVQFDLRADGETYKNVIFFANWPTPLWIDGKYVDPVCIKDAMPDTWHPDYKWDDLNILTEAIFVYEQGFGFFSRPTNKIDHKGLYVFIKAFLGECPDGIYMHVSPSTLPKK